MRSFFSNLNVRLIIVYLVAFWFFYYGTETLAFLYDRALAEPTLGSIIHITQKSRYESDEVFIRQMGNIGLLAAYVISWFVSSKKGWHWINGVIAFVIAFALGYLNWFGWDHLSGIFLAPGRIFKRTSAWNFIVSGSLMLAIGSLLFFWKKVQLFIDRGNYVNKKTIEADKKKRRIR
jgi:hypothetical protein